jgi:ADP-ribose pyrophosphatase
LSLPGYEIRKTLARFRGTVFELVTDEVTMPDGSSAERDYLRHAGSVAVVAIDDQERVMLVRQYRHATREVLWELPAGLLDEPGEEPAVAAARELAEEAGLVAARWEPLLAVYTSPGYSNEMIRIFLAQDLGPAPPDFHFHAQFEEAELTKHQVPLAEAVAMVYRGEITNGPTALGLLATWHHVRQA